jgi:hypothetical protein
LFVENDEERASRVGEAGLVARCSSAGSSMHLAAVRRTSCIELVVFDEFDASRAAETHRLASNSPCVALNAAVDLRRRRDAAAEARRLLARVLARVLELLLGFLAAAVGQALLELRDRRGGPAGVVERRARGRVATGVELVRAGPGV